MQLLRITVEHDCPFSMPLRRHAGVRATHLCHRGSEALLEVHGSEAEAFAAVVAEYEALGGSAVLRGEDGLGALVRFATCACCRSGRVIPAIEAAGQLYLPPSAYGADGREVYQFLAHEATVDTALLARLPEGVRVVQTAVRPLSELGFEEGFLVPVGTLFGELTTRQRLALVTAVRRGYYRIPRPVTTAELSTELSISREAFEALLRKAENKLVSGLFPYLVLGDVPDPAAAGSGTPGEGRRGRGEPPRAEGDARRAPS